MSGDFIFHGVGQGLFYSGSIFEKDFSHSFNFVYDCGSITYIGKHPLYLNAAINRLPFQNIDWLIISHLHEDHINGLPLLLKRCHVNRIFLPYFDARTYRNVFIAYLIARSIYPNTRLFSYLIRWYECEFNFDGFEHFDNELPKCELHLVGNGHQPYSENVYLWKFLFFNKRISQRRYRRFQSAIQSLLKGQSIENYILSCNGNFSALKTQFKLIFKNANLSSLLLLHYKYKSRGKMTLLTGDVESDRNLNTRLEKAIFPTKRNIIMQTPHHGSKTAWNKFSKQIKYNARQVISFGYGNSFRHPNSLVIYDLISKRIPFYLVTQIFSFHYTIP